MIQLMVFLLPAPVSVSVYMADCVEYEVQVGVFRILMQGEGNLIFRADLVADGHSDAIQHTGSGALPPGEGYDEVVQSDS